MPYNVKKIGEFMAKTEKTEAEKTQDIKKYMVKSVKDFNWFSSDFFC